MATEKPRYSITLDEDLFEEIENFRFEKRFQTRNQATIELIKLGLQALIESEQKKRANNRSLGLKNIIRYAKITLQKTTAHEGLAYMLNGNTTLHTANVREWFFMYYFLFI